MAVVGESKNEENDADGDTVVPRARMFLRFSVQGAIIAGVSPLLFVPQLVIIPIGWIYIGFAAVVGLVAGFVAGVGSLAGIRMADAIAPRGRYAFVALGGAVGAALALWLIGMATAPSLGGFGEFSPWVLGIGTIGAALLSPLTVYLTLRNHRRRSTRAAQPINS